MFCGPAEPSAEREGSRIMNRVCAAVLVGCGLAASSFAQGPKVLREGEGTRRAELTAMELQPFAVDALGKLSSWQNGDALTADAIAGKPVLFCTWGDWYQPSKRAVSLGTKMAEKFGKDGLVVVMVHHERGWDAAKKPTAPAGSTMLVAHDAAGDFRKALKVDQDPDFYLVDRAGQMRYADIQIDSVEAAVAELVAEKQDAAASLKSRLANTAAEQERERLKSEALKGSVKFTAIPEQDFPLPSAEDYRKVEWPPVPKDPNQPNSGQAALPKLIQFPDSNWFPAKPEMKGRAVVLYFWSPLVEWSYRQSIDDAERLAVTFGRDVVVVGIAMDFSDINGTKIKDEDKDFNKFVKRVEEVYSAKKLSPNHVMVAENGSTILRTFTADPEIPMPYLAMASSNLEARWWPIKSEDGQTYVVGMNFYAALRQVIELDPAIQRRQKAEEAYIKAQTK
jgi:hypothetical protein